MMNIDENVGEYKRCIRFPMAQIVVSAKKKSLVDVPVITGKFYLQLPEVPKPPIKTLVCRIIITKRNHQCSNYMFYRGNIPTWDLGVQRHGDVELLHRPFKRFHINLKHLQCTYFTLLLLTLVSSVWCCVLVFVLKLPYLRLHQPVILSKYNHEREKQSLKVLFVKI